MRKADNVPPSCAVVTKSGNLNFLEPSGPVQACNGTEKKFRIIIKDLCYRTITVILAKHCIKLPDDGSLVIRNMLEKF